MRLFNIGVCAALTAVLLACASPAFAAGTPFSVHGQVVDRYGNPVQGASVTLIDQNFKTLSASLTGENGSYDFANVIADTGTCTVQFSYTDPQGTKYELPAPYNRASWYPASGARTIPSKETTLTNYPPPVYGYLYGAILDSESASGRFIDGVVYLTGLDDGVKYYQYASRTDGKGSYQFYALPGPYILYAQHFENGIIYESARKQITIKPNNDPAEILETRIVLPLYGPASSPDPPALPAHYENTVSGTVTEEGGAPIQGATVTLYQMADNGSTFIPMMGAGSKPLATTTDAGGNYEFRGVSPTTDDGKAIHSKKSIKAMVDYALTDNLTVRGWSVEKALYYPDVILGNGAESRARDVTLPVVFSVGDGTQPQATISVSDVPRAPSNIAVVPLVAALAIGLLCLGGLYLAFNRKG